MTLFDRVRDAVDDAHDRPKPPNLFQKVRDQFAEDPGEPEMYSTSWTPTADWHEVDFGFRANLVSIRSDGDLVVSFVRPYEREQAHIDLTAEEFPFSLGGGDNPVGSDSVWVRRHPDESREFDIKIIAKGY